MSLAHTCTHSIEGSIESCRTAFDLVVRRGPFFVESGFAYSSRLLLSRLIIPSSFGKQSKQSLSTLVAGMAGMGNSCPVYFDLRLLRD